MLEPIQKFRFGRLALFGRCLRTAVVAALSAVLCSCATTAVPVGPWARLSDLNLSAHSLDHVRVAIRCGRFDGGGQVQEHSYRLCRSMVPWLTSLGASVVSPTDEPRPEYTLWYVDSGIVEKESSGVSLVASILTGYILPYVSTAASESELRLLDARGVVVDKQTLRLQEVTVFGWSALYSMFAFSERKDRNRLSLRFYRYAQNRLVSQVAGAPPTGGAGL